jgi:hypothetical protein
MRSTLIVAGIAALAAVSPSRAAADVTLRLALFDGPHQRLPSLAVPDLHLPAGQALGLAEGADAPQRQVEPPVALVLGIIPGFGLGHYLAGSRQWPIWLIADLVIFVVWPGGFAFTSSSGYALLGLLVLGERIFEGISAYQAAGGGPLSELRSDLASPTRLVSPAALALPPGAPGAFLR